MSTKPAKESDIGRGPGPQEHADLVEEETPGPNVCMKHPKAILTGKSCDACLATVAFLRLTDE